MSKTVRIQREQTPNPTNQEVYRQVYDVYLETYIKLRDVFPKMGW